MSDNDSKINEVWCKGEIVVGYDEKYVRQDQCNAWIKYSEYGNRDSRFGWEMHHILAKSKGGSDDVSNLIPLQWENNLDTAEYDISCSVTSEGEDNIEL